MARQSDKRGEQWEKWRGDACGEWRSSGDGMGIINSDVKDHRRIRATETRRILTSQQETGAARGR